MRKTTAGASAGAVALCLACLPQLEGVVLKGYKDPVGIVTACVGETKTAVLGKPYTREECMALLQLRVNEHADGIAQCVDMSRLTVGEQAASISFGYNVGVDAFCHSTFARKLSADDPGACAELSRWIYAGQGENRRVLNGLVNRRKIERDICEGRFG